ncbi:App1 family protein [Longitalea luteola]|uniref:App1 family protein n=1 Tax=Longitalea luteola TaxID=2812563 RepID=UPI001A975AF4|nr:phosphatase domain-containing protein [Longitalea luteola]
MKIKVYQGYGHTKNLVIYGHVLKKQPAEHTHYSKNKLVNALYLLRLFFVKPFPQTRVKLRWGSQEFFTVTDDEGFFKFEWSSEYELDAGWHNVTVDSIDEAGAVIASGTGRLYVPHSTQYVFVSDIDDTVMVSHTATTFRRMWELLRHPHSRRQFKHMAEYYQALAQAQTEDHIPNPFFYVSSSEWNLYDYLTEFFMFNRMAEGIFLLSELKRIWELFRSGQTKHGGKQVRIERLLSVFPKEQFILLGDNSQKDPEIYTGIAAKFPQRIFAIYIRNVRPEKAVMTAGLLQRAQQQGVHTLLFERTAEAKSHSEKIGLIS